MEIRPVTSADLNQLMEIDGTIETVDFLFIEQAGQGAETRWTLQPRPLRQKQTAPNRIGEEHWFAIRQIVGGADEGMVLMADHQQLPVAMVAAQPRPQRNVLQILDLRVDYDFRRQGLGSALLFGIIQQAREKGYRAVAASADSGNVPGVQLLLKCGFELCGLDTHRHSNHDLVKEAVSLFFYASFD
ncbi:MAG: GNAT family N-acetyltransferase [Phycisphaerales bacterium]|jgi:L-amino acid N-acyltransferase YncA|nr:GNAT family N-acetyltransferase [Phycisphaerales bacterium]